MVQPIHIEPGTSLLKFKKKWEYRSKKMGKNMKKQWEKIQWKQRTRETQNEIFSPL